MMNRPTLGFSFCRFFSPITAIGLFSLAIVFSGCFWITSPFTGPTFSYPLNEVEGLAWSPDGSKCVTIERQTASATSGSTYALVSYDREGAQTASIALSQDLYPYGQIFVDPANANVFLADGSSVQEVSLSTGLVSQLAFSYDVVSESASGKYLLLSSSSSSSPHSFQLLDISGNRPRAVHQWSANLSTYSVPSVGWLGDSLFAYLDYSANSVLSLFVFDVNLLKHDSLSTVADLDAMNATVLGGGGSFYLGSRLGVTKLAAGTGGTMLIQDTAAAASISADGRVIAYGTSVYYGSTLRLLNPATGKTSTISSSALKPHLTAAGDRIAYIESPDYSHSILRISHVQIP